MSPPSAAAAAAPSLFRARRAAPSTPQVMMHSDCAVSGGPALCSASYSGGKAQPRDAAAARGPTRLGTPHRWKPSGGTPAPGADAAASSHMRSAPRSSSGERRATASANATVTSSPAPGCWMPARLQRRLMPRTAPVCSRWRSTSRPAASCTWRQPPAVPRSSAAASSGGRRPAASSPAGGRAQASHFSSVTSSSSTLKW
jgi:hypothetical protein